MEREVISKSTTSSSSMSWTPKTKVDIVAFAVGNPANKTKSRLSKTNQNLFGNDSADLFTKRHYHELQRCSQFYSMASILNETSTKDKHRMNTESIKKMISTGQKYIIRLFACFYE
jgi:hypothetical protein